MIFPFKKTKSLFAKLLGIYGLTFFLVIVSIGLGFRASHDRSWQDLFKKNVKTYASYLVADIGLPPDLAKAKEIHERLGVEIQIVSEDLNWSATPATKSLKERFETFRINPHRSGVFLIELKGYEFYLGRKDWRDRNMSWWPVLLGMLIAVLILIASYAWTRRIFRPISELKEVSGHFGAGNFSARMATKGSDEVASIGQSFNQMAERIQNQIHAMKQLLIAVSHEFRSPLGRMRIALEMMPNNKHRQSLIDEISVLDKITERILAQERLDSGATKPIPEPQKISEWAANALSVYRDRIELALEDASGVTFSFDEDLMQICVRNLVENALRHGGKEHKARVAFAQVDEKLVITVEDEGPGVEDAQLERLGEPFFQADSARTPTSGQSHGLGLSFCKSIVEAHGGTIHFSNRRPRGLRVEISLPGNL